MSKAQKTPVAAQKRPSERPAGTDWYAASLTEVRALLDAVSEQGEVTLRAGDVGTAALIAMLNASTVVYSAGQAVEDVVRVMRILETEW